MGDQGSSEDRLEALRLALNTGLEQLRAQLRAENNDDFLMNLASLEATFRSGEEEARRRYDGQMVKVVEMKRDGKMSKLIEITERMAVEQYQRILGLHEQMLESFIRDCAPPGFRIVEEG